MSQTFQVPVYRYKSSIPKNAVKVFDVKMPTATSTVSSGLENIPLKENITEITTTDPKAFLIFSDFRGQVIEKIQTPPGTYRFISTLLSCTLHISHASYPGYDYVYYKTRATRKLRAVKVYTKISGNEYYYYQGEIRSSKSPPTPTDVKIPRQIPPSETPVRCCPTCKQKIPSKQNMKREEKNRRRLPEKYPSYFKRKIDSLVESGFLIYEDKDLE